jgi:putative oxidoreductase
MTTLFAPASAPDQTVALRRGRNALAALWIAQLAVAGMMLFAGGLKLAGAPQMVALFDAIGIGQWFRYLTGGIEVASGAALLVPSLAPFAALVLVPTMIGAVITHLLIVGGSAAPAVVLLAGSLAIAWARREQLARAVHTALSGPLHRSASNGVMGPRT